MNELKDKNRNEEDDFVWRFQLNPPDETAGETDPMIEMFRSFLADFLRIGFLTKDGARVDANGFVFVADPETVHEIFPSKT